DVGRIARIRATVAGAVALALAGASIAAAQAAPAPVAPAAPPSSFRGVALGMSVNQVKEILRQDALYRYRGDPDVSFLPSSGESLIECEGSSYLGRAYFQFAGGALYVFILVLDPKKLDHYSMFTAFSAKYGPPTSFNPQEAVWQSDAVRFSLERPLTVKYIDRRVFDAQVARGAAQQDLEMLSRERFIEQF
ncbi:MAG TPA: hypothetical protein VLH81_14700, partial [Desulfobacterales bacterium]|nr:hypothetical protein [Desulfobacterales bacterium]